MAAFYSLPEWASLSVSMAAAVCTIMQAMALVYMLARDRKKDTVRIWENILQISVLLQSFVLLYLMAQVQRNKENWMIVRSDQYFLRCAVFVLAAVLSVVVLFLRKNGFPLLVALASLAVLPAAEQFAGSAFLYGYCLSLAFYILRAVHMMILCRREIREELSRGSVKYAVDKLHTGVLFCEKNGRILLINEQMQRLMTALCGEGFRDGKQFYERLTHEEVLEGCRQTHLAEKTVFQIPDGTVWLFVKAEIFDKKHPYIQLSAADVTEQWKLTKQLQEQRSVLQKRGDELKGMIENVQELCREEETLRIKSHFHDILGQRLALLLRNLRENREPDEQLLAAFADGLSKELKETGPVVTASDRLDTLRRMMDGIGVTLYIDGSLPAKETLAWLGMDIITEAVTNSVRHGLASEIYIRMGQERDDFLLRITDNGIPPKEEITEGGGITGMRRKLRMFDGALAVLVRPQFVLSVSVPGGEQR
jgi:signal transduction histidine kinase